MKVTPGQQMLNICIPPLPPEEPTTLVMPMPLQPDRCSGCVFDFLQGNAYPPQNNAYPPQNNTYPPLPPPHQGAPLLPNPGFFPPGYGPPNMAALPPFPGRDGFGAGGGVGGGGGAGGGGGGGGGGAGAIPNMEFRRGGSGPGHRRQEVPDRRRPTQNYYLPPSRKKEG